jgi:hypothetical protein
MLAKQQQVGYDAAEDEPEPLVDPGLYSRSSFILVYNNGMAYLIDGLM